MSFGLFKIFLVLEMFVLQLKIFKWLWSRYDGVKKQSEGGFLSAVFLRIKFWNLHYVFQIFIGIHKLVFAISVLKTSPCKWCPNSVFGKSSFALLFQALRPVYNNRESLKQRALTTNSQGHFEIWNALQIHASTCVTVLMKLHVSGIKKQSHIMVKYRLPLTVRFLL